MYAHSNMPSCLLAHAMSPPWLYACYLPCISLTIPPFCTCSPPYITLFNLFVEFGWAHVYGMVIFMNNACGVHKPYKFRPEVIINVREAIICSWFELWDLECYLMWLILCLLGWCQAVTTRTKSTHIHVHKSTHIGHNLTSTQAYILVIGKGLTVFTVWQHVLDTELRYAFLHICFLCRFSHVYL